MHLIADAGIPAISHRRVVTTFAATTFIASTLLFLVQPMFAKMVLPRLGGSPAVWNACVLFFQTTLLLGYCYAHLTVRWLGARRQAMLQVVVMASALTLLPLTLGNAAPSDEGSPVWWLLKTLTLRLGLPFFALSTMAPLVQRWFATLPVPSADNPYFLYAASNTGSMLALVAYPFILEPLWGTRTQTIVWAVGYALLLALAVLCAVALRRGNGGPATVVHRSVITWRQKMQWTALAFVPSSLMLGVTTHISTDLASMPLLWVLPLAAYLLTFVLVFSSRDRIPRTLLARALPVLVLVAFVTIALQVHALWTIPLHLAAFFVAALTCHDALARERPPVADLTAFYVWMAFGGMLGGAFNTLLAPWLFTGIHEYPIVLALACLARSTPMYRRGQLEPWGFFVVCGVVPLVVGAALWLSGRMPPGVSFAAVLILSAIIPGVLSAATNRRTPFNALAIIAVAALMIASSTRSARGEVIFAGRSFFGVSRVVEANDHSYRLLQHGTTLHGRQNLPAGDRCSAQSYYDVSGPVGDLFTRAGRHFSDVAVVGLGSGGLSCYAEAGSRWTFFEIDPLVERIARDAALFTFIPNSAGQIAVRIGDGRKLLEAMPPASYDLVILDAFSSDAVPVHLLTREAIGAYLSKLRAGGIVALHISNRYLDLEPVVAGIAAELQLTALTNRSVDIRPEDALRGRVASQWVVLANAPALLASVRERPGWRPLVLRDGVHAWTDDYSNLLRSIRWR